MLAATWSLRPDGHTLDSYKEYCNHPTAFTLKINHGGQLTCPPNVRYIGGKSNWFDDVDADTFSTIEVQTMVKDLGSTMEGRTIQGPLVEKCNCYNSSEVWKEYGRDQEMYNWLKDIPPQHWARSHFSGRPHCDVLLNNMCEVLNRQLLKGRDKPIVTCLEFIREYLMKRIVIVQGIIDKSTGQT
ncbi:hypothetical protein Tco_1564992 [Tanacetum coccineum]